MYVLQVVHALPAATYGGTELYTTWLAEALVDGGHDVTVATPRGAKTEIAGATVLELPDPADWFDPTGMDSGLGCGVVHGAVDDAFEALLDSVGTGNGPDVVHFQHLKYTSATLPLHCRERGIPSILTLHDFWTMCHRGQLHQPDGRPCEGPESVAKCTACYGESLRRAEQSVRADGDGGARDDRSGRLDRGDGSPLEGGDGQPRQVADSPDPSPTTGPAAESGEEPAAESGEEPAAESGEEPAAESGEEPAHRVDVAGRTDALAAAREAIDLLVSPSSFLRETFVEYGTPADAIVQCRNGIRTGNYRDTGFDPTDGIVFGFAGRITPDKGVHVLLEAFDGVEADDAELLVFGQFDPDADEYHARLASAADDRVTFRGFYEDNATPAATADVLVVPSLWYENSPLVIQEAFASGVPVVAGDVGGMAELVRDGRDGLTVPVGDPAALAERLQRLADDPELARELRRGIDPPKDLDEHVGEIESLYDAVRGSVRRREESQVS